MALYSLVGGGQLHNFLFRGVDSKTSDGNRLWEIPVLINNNLPGDWAHDESDAFSAIIITQIKDLFVNYWVFL